MVYLKVIVGEKHDKGWSRKGIAAAEKPSCKKLKMEKTPEPLNILLKILQLGCILLNMNLHSEIILSKIEVEM